MEKNRYNLNELNFAKLILNAVSETAVLSRKFPSNVFVSYFKDTLL